ncbi:MAG TPA: hypothetical protein VNW71_10250 [Thermoanaerobaculia bacterium]|nr:hypothetical protein [Thermoanaerobaculia bacterium]
MIPNLDEAPYSEGLRRVLYDAVARIVLTPDSGEPGMILYPDSGNLAVFYAWGRWFAVWRDFDEDASELPISRIWQVVRLVADPSSPDGIMMHEV